MLSLTPTTKIMLPYKAASWNGMKEEVDNVKRVKVCSPGFGAAVNCIMPLVNVEDDYDARTMGMSGVTSSTSPGAGAFTPYYGRRWKAKKFIPAGMELFGNYGETYFKTRRAYDQVPLSDNYSTIDLLLASYLSIIGFYDNNNQYNNNNNTQQHDTSSSSSSSSLSLSSDWKIGLLEYLQSLSSIWDDSKNMNAIPKTKDLDEIHWLLQPGRGSGYQHYNSSIRSLDWLQQNGRCMDNLKEGISTIPHAGRGAFASRFIAKDDIVSPVPLIHIPDRTIFTIYDQTTEVIETDDDDDDDGETIIQVVPDHDKPIHQQLLLNYCFGHRDSDLLLCPYGLLTSLINHDSVNPNTKVVWAKDEHMGHPEWRDQSIELWGEEDHAGLSFNFVALRDIAPGEEVTINYGPEWERAWNEHIRRFDRRDQWRQNYIPAFELNKLTDNQLYTTQELDYASAGVRLFCRKEFVLWAGIDLPIIEDTESFVDWEDNEIVRCRIIQRNDGGDSTYIAEIFERKESLTQSTDVLVAIVFNLPRNAFHFLDEIYQRDHHQLWSFRYDMRIPDEIFPQAWRAEQ